MVQATSIRMGNSMEQSGECKSFSIMYGTLRNSHACVEEGYIPSEDELQQLWFEKRFPEIQHTVEGHHLRIISPGWWNKGSGPDFLNAQVEFNGQLCTGDVEVHVHLNDWFSHKHHLDSEYDNVILHVVGQLPAMGLRVATTKAGRSVATLVVTEELQPYSRPDKDQIARRCGRCGSELAGSNPDVLYRFIELAGEWRMLEKARRMQERMLHVGGEQTVYESFMAACGYSSFKTNFEAIARSLPYPRVRQLAQHDPLVLEAAFLKLADLIPEPWPFGTPPPDHYSHITQLVREQLPGLKSLDLQWPRHASRPANNPERRLAGAARFLTRTAEKGLEESLNRVWRCKTTPLARRHKLEEFFGGAMGFWAERYTWNGASLKARSAPLGEGRIRSIIGNVFIPAALAYARSGKSEVLMEHNAYELFLILPGEPKNHIYRRMTEWLSLEGPKPQEFRLQQGLKQLYDDWCAHNPSCRQCSLLAYLQTRKRK